VKLINISRYQQDKIMIELKFMRDGESNPLRKTPKLGNDQAARLANIAAIETTDGLRMTLGGSDILIFAETPTPETGAV